MRTFHILGYDAVIDGTTSVYMDSSLYDLLGVPDRLTITAITDSVSGTLPTLTVQIEHSGDKQNWVNKTGTPEISNATLNTSGITQKYGHVLSSSLPAAFVRARVQLGGTSPRARVRIWFTGRSEQVL